MNINSTQDVIALLRATPALPQNGSKGAAYMRGENSALFTGWNPPVRRLEYDVRAGWQKAAARATDVIQNQGFIAGAIEQATASCVGKGLRLKYRPHFVALGMEENEETRKWARDVQEKFTLWAEAPEECDAEGRSTLGQLAAKAYKHWFATGEIFGSLPYFVRSGWKYGTKVRLLPATRIANHNDEMAQIVHGVQLDRHGAAGAFYLHEGQFGKADYLPKPFKKYDDYGRNLLIHVFDGLPGQIRGISPLAPVLRVLKQFDRLSDSTMTAATISACFAATIESDEPTEAILRSLQTPMERSLGEKTEMESYFEASLGFQRGAGSAQINLDDNGRIIQMFPGRKLVFNESKQQNTNYASFAKHLLMEIARCLGQSYQSATGDYEGSSYNSNISTITDIYAVTMYRRETLLKPFYNQVFASWLEEAIDIGEVVIKGGLEAFYANRAALTRCDWLGMGKPTADDLKRAKTLQMLKMIGVYSDEYIAAELGLDIDEVYASRARCAELRELHGLDLYDQPFTQLAPDEADEADHALDAEEK